MSLITYYVPAGITSIDLSDGNRAVVKDGKISVDSRFRNEVELAGCSAASVGNVTAETISSGAQEVSVAGVPLLSVGNLPLPLTETTTSFLSVYPTDNTTPRYLEKQIHVPIGGGVYFGAYISDKNRATYSVAHITETCLAKPAMHVLAASLSKVGTWTSSAAAAAFTGNYAWSATAGDTISGSVSGSELWVRQHWTTNGGYGIVSIDGSYTKANRLPKFTPADLGAGLCRASDVGKAYINSYSGAPYGDAVIIADGLDSGSHAVVVEVTGTKPVASSATRVYIEAFAGSGTASLPPTANVHFCPLFYVQHQKDYAYNAYEWVASWAPSGSSDYQFLGSMHADNTNSKETSVSLAVTVDGVDQSALAAGSYASGQLILITQASTVAHKANLATVVLNKTRTYTAMAKRPLPVMCKVDATWQAAGTINYSYPAMMSLGYFDPPTRTVKQDLFTKVMVGHQVLDKLDYNDNRTSSFHSDAKQIRAYGPAIEAWCAFVSATPDVGALYSAGRVSLQDRTDINDKAYIADVYNAIIPTAAGQTTSYVAGWGARLPQ